MRLLRPVPKIIGFLLLLFPVHGFCQAVRFNNRYSMACHNCYEKKRASDFQDVFNYTKTIELDIWNENFGLGFIANIIGKSLKNDWYVKHKPQQRGNQNCVGGSFRDCLEQIKAWSVANPLHDVITVYIDKKQNWCNGYVGKRPIDLDRLLLSVFDPGDIFRPADLLGNKESLRKAAFAKWPPLDSLKGKLVFVLTDGTVLSRHRLLNDYMKSQKNDALCFVSPRIGSEEEIVQPKGFSKENAANVVFFNLKEANGNLAEKINAAECISRVYGSSKKESVDRYEKLVNEKVNFVAFYNYKLPTTETKELPPPRKGKP